MKRAILHIHLGRYYKCHRSGKMMATVVASMAQETARWAQRVAKPQNCLSRAKRSVTTLRA